MIDEIEIKVAHVSLDHIRIAAAKHDYQWAHEQEDELMREALAIIRLRSTDATASKLAKAVLESMDIKFPTHKMRLQRLTALVNDRGWWLEGIKPPRTTHYFPKGSDTSLCGLVMVGRYDRGVRRVLKHWQGCGLCRIRLALKHSTPFNSPRQMRLV